jgi:hypothetical protein
MLGYWKYGGMLLDVRELKCPRCGAPVDPHRDVCGYCNARYIIVGESETFLFGRYVECNTFKRLQSLIMRVQSIKRGFVGNTVEVEKIRRLLHGKACKLCQIKNCPFFNQDFYEMFRRTFPTKRLHLTDEEYKRALREAVEEAIR